jgi:hypothetical protein
MRADRFAVVETVPPDERGRNVFWQVEGTYQGPERIGIRLSGSSALQVGDRTRADPGTLGEFLLG